jgi:hypothetical protein
VKKHRDRVFEGERIAVCISCGADLARLVDVDVSNGPMLDSGGDVVYEGGIVYEHHQIGRRITLDLGYVNAGRKHASGRPWYVFSRKSKRRKLTVRAPFVVTCRCGTDRIVAGADERSHQIATAPHAGRDILADEAGDRYIHSESGR